jgi:hypothetical protein
MWRMNDGGIGKRPCSGNDTGAGAANPAPPSVSASTIEERPTDRGIILAAFRSAADETARDEVGGGDPVEGDGEDLELIRQYRRMIEGNRQLPRKMRAPANKRAAELLRSSLKTLKERRAIDRHARREERRKRIRRRGVFRRRPPGLNL